MRRGLPLGAQRLAEAEDLREFRKVRDGLAFSVCFAMKKMSDDDRLLFF
jgi:hypothetical protein